MTIRRQPLLLILPGLAFLLTFLIFPMFSIVVFSFWRTESYVFIQDWNVDNYLALFREPTYIVFFWRSLVMAVVVSLLCLIYAWPVALFIARHGGRYKLVLLLLTSAPFLTGEILRITALQQILGPIGLINMGVIRLGLEPIEALTYSHFTTGIGLIYLWLPFMIIAIILSLENFDFNLLAVAEVAGASPLRAFFEITWPLNRAGTTIGLVLVFIPTLGSSLTSQFLGGPNGALYGNVLSHQFGSAGTWAFGSAMAVVLIAVSAIVIALAVLAVGDPRRSGITPQSRV